jgi:hypothetical protein
MSAMNRVRRTTGRIGCGLALSALLLARPAAAHPLDPL